MNLLLDARLEAGLTRPELATFVGVAPSTLLRIERGQVSPTVEMVQRLFDAMGTDATFKTQRRVDVAPMRAALVVLDGRRVGDEAGQTWVRRWSDLGWLGAAGEVDRPARITRFAGTAAPLARRPGAVWARSVPLPELAARLNAAGIANALTGGAAANRLVPSAAAGWTVAYVAEPDQAASSIGLEPAGERGQRLTLLPIDQCDAANVATGELSDGTPVRWVAGPAQTLIDCYCGTDRMPEQADALARSMFGTEL